MHLSTFLGILFIVAFIAYMYYETTRIRDDAESYAREHRARIAARFSRDLPQVKYTSKRTLRYHVKQLLSLPSEIIGQLRTLIHLTYRLRIARS